MDQKTLNLTDKIVSPLTLVYLTEGNAVLMLKRAKNKQMLPGKWLGLGGKVEPKESIVDSVKREFLEETGLTIYDPVLRGSFTWINDSKYIGTVYIFHSEKYSGTLHKVCDEGILAWHPIDSIVSLPDLADHQRGFLPDILKDPLFFYTGIGLYDDHSLISCSDSKRYFNSRSK